MDYVITIALSVISGTLVYIVQNLIKENHQLRERERQEEETKEGALIEAIVCLLRVKLIEYHGKYIKEEHIPSYAYDNWVKMFKAYTALGGNGMIVGMNDEIEKLPIQ